jgi:hypothetical protein|tara:strand:+ start:1725 stop:1841 length:117 start_codon:yes stop_codon:yes gene_type:complete
METRKKSIQKLQQLFDKVKSIKLKKRINDAILKLKTNK